MFLPREPSEEERKQLNKLGKRSEHTRFASSTAQLQDDIALVLHRPFEQLPLNAQAALQQLRRCDPLLAGRKVLVIDDDIRNIFSLPALWRSTAWSCIMRRAGGPASSFSSACPMRMRCWSTS